MITKQLPLPELEIFTPLKKTAVLDGEVLLWVDVEATHLNPATSELLQVAAVLTDLEGVELADEFSMVIYHPNGEELYRNSIPLIQEMHSSTGLWGKLATGTPLPEVDAALLKYVQQGAPEYRQARLAGNSIRLDLNFLEACLPNTYNHLHYRSVDVTALAYVFQAWGIVDGYFPKRKAHEALEDIRESLEEYRWLRRHLSALQS
jgi:oligoribonuclease